MIENNHNEIEFAPNTSQREEKEAENKNAEKQNILEVVNLTKKFGDLLVLDDISETINAGEKVVVIGPSGGGKSTFLRCLNCLEDPTAGKIVFDGTDLADRKVNINTHRQKMGMVFQQFNLFNNLTVKKNITLAPIKIGIQNMRKRKLSNLLVPYYNKFVKKYGEKYNVRIDKKRVKLQAAISLLREQLTPITEEWEKSKSIEEKAGKRFVTYDPKLTKQKLAVTTKLEKKERKLSHTVHIQKRELVDIGFKSAKEIRTAANENAMRLLKRIGLEDKADVYPSTLSGGQKQRVAIVRSLAMNPTVMLFDEPTSALDPEMIGEVLDLIKQVADEGMTMVIVTHEMNFAKEIGTRVLFMAEGKILEQAPPQEFFGNPQHPRLREFLSKILG